jgi:hypothetical protein
VTWDTSRTKYLVDLAGFCKDGIVFAALLGEFEDVRSVEWVGDIADVTILLVEGREGGMVMDVHCEGVLKAIGKFESRIVV